jgi:hypothetical protein
MKNVLTRQKPAGPPPGTSSGRLNTASRTAAQPLPPGNLFGVPPGSASRQLQTGSIGAQRRPTTAIQSAGFVKGSLGSNSSSSGPAQFERKEDA